MTCASSWATAFATTFSVRRKVKTPFSSREFGCNGDIAGDDEVDDDDEENKKREQENDELKKQRERERKAARLALEQIEKTVEFDDNFQVTKDFYELIQCYPNHTMAEVEEGEILTED
ncbi:hypothetical protein RHMOL_Rhmol12G0186900 [Rhododendron molle]|uniref:Uncharacterized protein n=1 Tax=Rhododendron molle TaxID=49168 RepID=A0ACC0LJQ0_RHOML|nr:hypothetical protein RHMOL_Rhmol12G0186900 [Rhododendron molle]